jgi:hypothetical protein
MSKSSSPTAARAVVDEVFGRAMTRELWTSNYEHALPMSVQYFDLGAILPAVFYMFRFGVRRGKGRFVETFAGSPGTARQQKQQATVERVASILSGTDAFRGFNSDVTRAILGDLLLCFCLENKGHALGRTEQVQRVAPAHYMASWVDLPDTVVHLRYVPEMIVALLADQDGFDVVPNKDDDKTWFAVGRGFEDNVLLRAFHQGVVRVGPFGDRTADRFQENAQVGLDQLLMIRLAQQLGAAPDKLRGSDGDKISNQRAIAKVASRGFSEDIRQFVRAYASAIPRHAFVALLESCMAVGLTTIITSTFEILFQWARTGHVDEQAGDVAPGLFVDCTNGVDPQLRGLAEQSLDDYLRRVETVPIILMALRLLDYTARTDPELKKVNPPKRPYATQWLCLLGDLLFGRHDESRLIQKGLDRKAQELADRLADEYPEAAAILQNSEAQPNPVWRLAEALTLLQGRVNAQANTLKMVDGAMMVGRPNGLAARRPVSHRGPSGETAKKRDLRSLTFTDAVLDYLVHRHVLRNGKHITTRQIALQEFMELLRKKHGFHVDQSPPGHAISNERLGANRQALERRLRDLGLLVGVSDAEAMKYLRPRFEVREEHDRVD